MSYYQSPPAQETHPDTGAVTVTPPVIQPVIRGGSGHARIITPYRADVFEQRLGSLGLLEAHSNLPGRIRNGFPIGFFDHPKLTRTYAPDNYGSGVKHLDFIQEYVNEQVSLGRMAGPYSRSDVEAILGSKFVSSPLFVIDKAGSPGKFRLIQDFSHENEDGVSLNEIIDTDDFPTSWGTAAEMVQIVATAPAGAQAASLDIDSAYRNIPILPDHKRYLVIQVKPGQFYIDHVCPFGVASGTGLQGQLMDAIVDILEHSGIKPIKKWVDDMVSFRFPVRKNAWGQWVYDYDVEKIFSLTKDLGVPWKLGKCFSYSERVVYVGFLWNLRDRSVSLPDEKRQKFLAEVDAFYNAVQAGSVLQREAISILGKLSHLTFVYTTGRAFLTNLISFAATFPNRKTPQTAPPAVKTELRWWQDKLRAPSFARNLLQRSAQGDPGVWVDASSSWGIGILIGGRWAAWRLTGDWETNNRNIGWAEMIAIELACLYLEVLKICNTDVVIHCDNQGVIGAVRQGRSRNAQVNLSIRRTELICAVLNICLSPEYVRTELNLADPVSRGVSRNRNERLPDLPRLPTELKPFLTAV